MKIVILANHQFGVAPRDQPVVASGGGEEMIPMASNSRPDRAVVEAGHDPKLEADMTSRHFGDPHEVAVVVGDLCAGHGEEVVDRDLAFRAGEGRHQHERVFLVALGRVSTPPSSVIVQWPPRSQSSRRPKQLPESNRGMQHQSIEPCLETRAAEWQSLISP